MDKKNSEELRRKYRDGSAICDLVIDAIIVSVLSFAIGFGLAVLAKG